MNQVLLIIVTVTASLLVAFVLYWKIRGYMGANPSSPLLVDEDGPELDRGVVRSYSVRTSHVAMESLRRANKSSPPTFAGTVYVRCGLGEPQMLEAEYTRAVWLPLIASRYSIELHNDVSSGLVNHLIIAGSIFYVWAIPPMTETANAVLLVVSEYRGAQVEDGCAVATVYQPLVRDSSLGGVNDQVDSLVNNGADTMVNLWAF